MSSLQIVREARSETRERAEGTVSSGASARQEGGRSPAGVRMEFTGETERSCQTASRSRPGVLPALAGDRAGHEGTYHEIFSSPTTKRNLAVKRKR